MKEEEVCETMKKRITFCILFLWMAVIFSFSAQNAEESSETSHSVAYRIAEKGSMLFHQEKTEAELRKQAESMQVIIRKGAHMTEYAILAILLVLHLDCYNFNKKKVFLLSWLFTTGYAATDEFHQLFVPGRAGQLRDVGIDSAGGLLGILFMLLLWKRQEKNGHKP